MAGRSREWMLTHGLNAMTPEQKAEAQSRGGQRSQEIMRRRKHMKEIAQDVLNMRLTGADEITHALREGGMVDADINYAAGIIMVQTQKAMGGDTKAAEFVRDTSGQKPTEGLLVGNLDDKPFETLDLTSFSEEMLREMAAARIEKLEEEE